MGPAPSLTDEEAQRYLNGNRDLRVLLNNEIAKAKDHWKVHGWKEGRVIPDDPPYFFGKTIAFISGKSSTPKKRHILSYSPLLPSAHYLLQPRSPPPTPTMHVSPSTRHTYTSTIFLPTPTPPSKSSNHKAHKPQSNIALLLIHSIILFPTIIFTAHLK